MGGDHYDSVSFGFLFGDQSCDFNAYQFVLKCITVESDPSMTKASSDELAALAE